MSIMVLGPILISLDRTDLRKAIVESKGTALSYITSWTSGDEDGEELEIGDDEDIDYDDYKDIEPGEEGVLDREKDEQVKNSSEEGGDEDYTEEDAKRGTDEKIDKGKESGTRTFLSALKSCTDMVCVQKAHELPKEDAKFNFPHFLIIGFQKAATTSLHVYVSCWYELYHS